jgi:hypothetical protein
MNVCTVLAVHERLPLLTAMHAAGTLAQDLRKKAERECARHAADGAALIRIGDAAHHWFMTAERYHVTRTYRQRPAP